MMRERTMMIRRSFAVLLAAAVLTPVGADPGWAAKVTVPFGESRLFIEFNQTDNDLGFHVLLDAEAWKNLKIVNPTGHAIFAVEGQSAYRGLGLTGLFFEGAEPNLNDFPLNDLLALFPEGTYTFLGKTVGKEKLLGTSTLSHAVPNGPGNVAATLGPNDSLVISWDPSTTVPPGFPMRPISIVGYQVIVEEFQVTVPGTVTSVTVSPEFVSTLPPGEVQYEVLAVDVSGNQTIIATSFVKP